MKFISLFQNAKIKSFLAVAACIVLPFIIYSPSLKAPFIFDDYSAIVDNHDIKDVKNLKTKLIYKTEYGPNKNDPSRPLTFLSFTLNYYFGNLNVFGYHLVNILLHIGVTILIFLLTRKIFFYIYDRQTIFFPLVCALLFSSHPINTEAVAYISHRSDGLATFFYLFSLLLFVKSFEKSKIFYPFSLLCFVLALGSKQIAVTLPAIILIFDYMFLSDFKKEKVFEKKIYHLSFWILLFGFIAFRYFYLGHFGDPGKDTYSRWNLMTYFVTQGFVLLKYLKFLFVPIGQCVDHFILPPKTFFESRVIFSAIFFTGLILSIYWIIKKHSLTKQVQFAFFWFFITLLPTSSIFPIHDAMAERRLYLAGWGFNLFVVYIYMFISQAKDSLSLSLRNFKFLIGFAALHILSLSLLTWKRNQLYQNPLLLWKEVVQKYPNNYRAYNCLGIEYNNNGQYSDAIAAYKKVIELEPNYEEAYNNLGVTYDAQKEYEKAKDAYVRSIQINPYRAAPYNNLGKIYFELNDYDQAMKSFKKAIESDPSFTVAYYNLATLFKKIEDYDQALIDYQKTVESDPSHADAWNNQGVIYLEKKDYAKALKCLKKAVELNPKAVEIHNNLGNLYSSIKEYEKALFHYRKAIELDPNYIDAHYNLGGSYYEQGKYPEALKEFEVALRLAPQDSVIKDKVKLLRSIAH